MQQETTCREQRQTAGAKDSQPDDRRNACLTLDTGSQSAPETAQRINVPQQLSGAIGRQLFNRTSRVIKELGDEPKDSCVGV